MINPRLASVAFALTCIFSLAACGSSSDNNHNPMMSVDPETAPRAVIDRFSDQAGTLFVRTPSNGLPAANEAIAFDEGPFITKGLGPGGELVEYYNFDVMPTEPAPIFVLFREGEDAPVAGQLNIVDVIPGDPGYNDFWHVQRVTVPANYVANTLTSLNEIMAMAYEIAPTNILVNCPIVPAGSTAEKRYIDEDNGLVEGWYEGTVVSYFNFSEKMLTTDPVNAEVPLSPIYVTFNINPDQEGGGPSSGFVTEMDSDQTHNVVATLPEDAAYSPLWLVSVYDNMDFDTVSDWTSATAASLLGSGVATPNCPIVSVQTGD